MKEIMMLRNIFLSFFTAIFLSMSVFAQKDSVVVANSDKFSGLDTLSTTSPDSAADRLRTLMFNSLVKKNERFEYDGELAKEIKIDYKNLTITFILNPNIKFHNGKLLTSADAKYTIEALFASGGYKSDSFFDSKPNPKDYSNPIREPHVVSIATPSPLTLVLKVRNIPYINQTVSNLVAIPIVPEGTIAIQKISPIGTGPFRFVRFEQEKNLVEFEANRNYWEGSPKIEKLIVRSVTDANALEFEFDSGNVDIAANPSNFSPETLSNLRNSEKLQVVESDGANIRYLGINVSVKTNRNLKLRQAIAFAIDREKIIREQFFGQAKIAHSILPPNSWAFDSEVRYEFDQAKAKKLLKEARYRGQIITLYVAAGNSAVKTYSDTIQAMLKDVGINLAIETLENNTLLERLKTGDFQMNTSIWVGGNQDPVFIRDLFQSDESPDKKSGGRNRSRYSNTEFNDVIKKAISATDKEQSRELYRKAQRIVARDLPLIPLWHPSNIVVANRRLGNIKMNPSGDWSFLKDVTKLR
jgi:peptide/nickel transport system substrate-binding protein